MGEFGVHLGAACGCAFVREHLQSIPPSQASFVYLCHNFLVAHQRKQIALHKPLQGQTVMPTRVPVHLQQPVGSHLNRHKLGDGCRHVFIDAGANRAVHTRFLMEGPSVFPISRFLRAGHFDRLFGPEYVSDPTVCAFCFEPNPYHARRLRDVTLRLRAAGRRVEVFNAAVADRAGSLTFHNPQVNGSAEDQTSNWGFQKKSVDVKTAEVQVPVIDLAAFILDELVSRIIPSPPSNMAPADVRIPSIMMKLDVEGAEIVILERMLSLGVLCEHLNTLVWEFHPKYLYNQLELANAYEQYQRLFDIILTNSAEMTGLHPGAVRKRRTLTNFNHTRLKDVHAHRMGALHASETRLQRRMQCNTSFFLQDDETYLLAKDVDHSRWTI